MLSKSILFISINLASVQNTKSENSNSLYSDSFNNGTKHYANNTLHYQNDRFDIPDTPRDQCQRDILSCINELNFVENSWALTYNTASCGFKVTYHLKPEDRYAIVKKADNATRNSLASLNLIRICERGSGRTGGDGAVAADCDSGSTFTSCFELVGWYSDRLLDFF